MAFLSGCRGGGVRGGMKGEEVLRSVDFIFRSLIVREMNEMKRPHLTHFHPELG